MGAGQAADARAALEAAARVLELRVVFDRDEIGVGELRGPFLLGRAVHDGGERRDVLLRGDGHGGHDDERRLGHAEMRSLRVVMPPRRRGSTERSFNTVDKRFQHPAHRWRLDFFSKVNSTFASHLARFPDFFFESEFPRFDRPTQL